MTMVPPAVLANAMIVFKIPGIDRVFSLNSRVLPSFFFKKSSMMTTIEFLLISDLSTLKLTLKYSEVKNGIESCLDYPKNFPYSYDTFFDIIVDVGEVPERSKGTDCKSVGNAFVGSNPTLATSHLPETNDWQASYLKD